jgi:hypothetical protein
MPVAGALAALRGTWRLALYVALPPLCPACNGPVRVLLVDAVP